MSRPARWLCSLGLILASAALAACGGSGSVPSTSSSASSQSQRPSIGSKVFSWLQPGVSAAHPGNNSAERKLTRTNVGSLGLGWSFATGAGIGTPILTDGSAAYAASGDDYLYSIDIATGAQNWKFQTEYYGETGSWIAIANGTVYAAPCFVASNTNGAGLCAVNASTGKLKWKWYATCNCGPEPAIVVGPVVYGSTVVFAYRTGGAYGKDYVIALNTAKGALLWQTVAGLGNPSGSMGPDLPAISGGNVYVGTDAGLCSLQLSSGSQNWCSGPSAFGGSPAVANGVVYVTNDVFGSGFYAFNATTGTQMWQYTPSSGNFGYADPPAIAGHTVFFAANSGGKIFALDTATGTLRFTAGGTSQGTDSLSSPSVANGVVYVACYTGLCAYNTSTGKPLAGVGPAGTHPAPAIANGEVFNSCYSGTNSAYDVCMYDLPVPR
jgi:outer membrane protein assembly factor BamB